MTGGWSRVGLATFYGLPHCSAADASHRASTSVFDGRSGAACRTSPQPRALSVKPHDLRARPPSRQKRRKVPYIWHGSVRKKCFAGSSGDGPGVPRSPSRGSERSFHAVRALQRGCADRRARWTRVHDGAAAHAGQDRGALRKAALSRQRRAGLDRALGAARGGSPMPARGWTARRAARRGWQRPAARRARSCWSTPRSRTAGRSATWRDAWLRSRRRGSLRTCVSDRVSTALRRNRSWCRGGARHRAAQKERRKVPYPGGARREGEATLRCRC